MSAGHQPSLALFDTLASRELLSRPSRSNGDREWHPLALRPRLPYPFDDSVVSDPNGIEEATEWTPGVAEAHGRRVAPSREATPPSSVEQEGSGQPMPGMSSGRVTQIDRSHRDGIVSRVPQRDRHERGVPEPVVTHRTELASRTQVTRIVEHIVSPATRSAPAIEPRPPVPAAPSARDRHRPGLAPSPRRERVGLLRPADSARDERETAIEIHIGRIDVRASVDQQPSRPPRRERPADPRLADYLRARTSGAPV